MTKKPLFLMSVSAVAAFILVIGFSLVGNRYAKTDQPVQFNHKVHTDSVDKNGAGLTCIKCHRYGKTQRNAGRPSTIQICKACHENSGDNPEKAKLVAFIERNEEVPWKRLYYVQNFVRFPHARHTDKVECETCHGPMADQTSPPGYPLVKLQMSLCVDCHKQRNVTTECLACHK